MKVIVVHNPSGLPTLPWRELHDFQGDLKKTSEEQLRKLADSIIRLGVFVPKFVWFEGRGKRRRALILDGHQTRAALELLESDGYEVPPIPYAEVVATDRKDAAEKLLQINSRYAELNPETTWFRALEFDPDELRSLVGGIEIPELDAERLLAGFDPGDGPTPDIFGLDGAPGADGGDPKKNRLQGDGATALVCGIGMLVGTVDRALVERVAAALLERNGGDRDAALLDALTILDREVCG